MHSHSVMGSDRRPQCVFHLVLFLFLSCLPHPSSSSDDVTPRFLRCFRGQTWGSSTSGVVVGKNLDKEYPSVLEAYVRNSRFNRSTTPKPLLIVTARTILHIQAAIACSKEIKYQMRIRSGGHDYEGVSYVARSYGFIVLDMSNFRSIKIYPELKSAYVQSGATLGELYHAIAKKSNTLGFPAGVCSTVGIGGHLSGGGYGNMLRKHGLTVDHVTDVVMVDANGIVLNRTSMGEDLFWAVRGGGGASFGVIVSFMIRLVDVPPQVSVFRVEKYVDDGDATDMVYKWQHVAPYTIDELFMRLLLQPVSSKKNKTAKTVRASVVALHLGDCRSLVSLLQKEFHELGLRKSDCKEMSWIRSVLWWAIDNATNVDELLDRNPNSANFLKRKSDYVQQVISKQNLVSIWDKLVELGKTGFVFNPYGGEMSRIASTETPFPHRSGNLFKIQYSVNWNDGDVELERTYLNQTRQLYEFMTPFVSKNPRSAYLNYRDLDIGVLDAKSKSYESGEVYGVKYFNDNFERLVMVKSRVDPDNVFWYEQSIPVKKTSLN